LVEKSFTCDFRGAEAAASRRILNRTIYRSAGRWGPDAAILIPAALYLGFAFYTHWSAWLGDYSLSAIVGAGILVLMYIRFEAPRINQRLFAQASGVAALEGRKISYEFNDEGYRIRTEHFEGFQKWAGVDRIIVEAGMVLFVLGPNAHFLPKRLFTTSGQRREFVAWVVERLTPAARAKSKIG
jgi:hypothetical protein